MKNYEIFARNRTFTIYKHGYRQLATFRSLTTLSGYIRSLLFITRDRLKHG